jgi:peptidoglycan hydrolase CwlO-like protein
MNKQGFLVAAAGVLAVHSGFAQNNAAAESAVMTETSVVMLHAVRTDCAAQFPALKAKLDASFAKLRKQHEAAFNTAENSADFDGRVDRMRSSIEARKDKVRYEQVCTKLAESDANWR